MRYSLLELGIETPRPLVRKVPTRYPRTVLFAQLTPIRACRGSPRTATWRVARPDLTRYEMVPLSGCSAQKVSFEP